MLGNIAISRHHRTIPENGNMAVARKLKTKINQIATKPFQTYFKTVLALCLKTNGILYVVVYYSGNSVSSPASGHQPLG